jgi:LPS export ABC transporter permease LptF
MLKLLDRYLLREMLFPFILTTFGFLIFMLLFLIGQFSNFLVDGLIPTGQMILLLVYKIPHLLVFAFPIATLFAIFLALGRMGHDREIIALQSSGISLRRILVPLLITGVILSGIDLWISNTLVPLGNHQFTNLYYQTLFTTDSTPEIRDNTFFDGIEDRILYIKEYDENSGLLRNITIIDETNKMEIANGNGGEFPTIITAESGRWDGEDWVLNDAIIHYLDNSGDLTFVTKADPLTINVGSQVQRLFNSSHRSPSEMSLGELSERIDTFVNSGLNADVLIVEYNMKLAIPFMCLVFALFGAPLALLMGPRSRALGIILCVLLVLVYQGVLFWTATIMGNRGDIPPELGAWVPSIIFGLFGLFLFFKANRFGRLDIIDRLRRVLPFSVFAIFIFINSTTAFAQGSDLPFEVETDTLVVHQELDFFTALGNVMAQYQDGVIEADELTLNRISDDEWEIEASDASFKNQELSGSAMQLRARFIQEGDKVTPLEIYLTQSASVKFSGGRIIAGELSLTHPEAQLWDIEAVDEVILVIDEQNLDATADQMILHLEGEGTNLEAWVAKDASIVNFTGLSDFTNAQGQPNRLRFEAEEASLIFDDENQLSLLDLEKGRFTTCTCLKSVKDADYSIRAGRLLIIPDELLAAFGITLSLFGQPLLWLPAYIAPLGDLEQKYPFLPEIGHSIERGYFAKWRLPFFADEQNFGYIKLEYYSRFNEVGTGLDMRYRLFEQSRGGNLNFTRLVGRGESLSLDWQEGFLLSDVISMNLTAALRTGLLSQDSAKLLSGINLAGNEEAWSWGFAINRDQNIISVNPEEGEVERLQFLLLERFPEFSLSKKAFSIAEIPLQISSNFQWGRYREVSIDEVTQESTRFNGGFQASTEQIELAPGAQLQSSASYRLTTYDETRRDSWAFGPRLDLAPIESATISVQYLWQQVKGQSPFQFDQVDVSNIANLDANYRLENGEIRIATRYDWQREVFAPLNAELTYRFEEIQTQFGLVYDLNSLTFDRASWNGNTAGDGWNLSLQTGYEFRTATIEDLIARFDLGPIFRSGFRIDLQQLALRRVSLQSTIQLGRWQVDLAGEYDLPQNRMMTLRYSLVRKFCEDCWQVGIFGDRDQVSFQAQINAFPSAQVRYSPTDQDLSFGR